MKKIILMSAMLLMTIASFGRTRVSENAKVVGDTIYYAAKYAERQQRKPGSLLPPTQDTEQWPRQRGCVPGLLHERQAPRLRWLQLRRPEQRQEHSAQRGSDNILAECQVETARHIRQRQAQRILHSSASRRRGSRGSLQERQVCLRLLHGDHAGRHTAEACTERDQDAAAVISTIAE